MANFSYEKRDLFSMPHGYCLAHCISSDFALGAGIAVEFDKRYNMRERLNKLVNSAFSTETGLEGETIQIDNVFNLITKRNGYEKPTYEKLEEALYSMKTLIVDNKIKYVAMPKIGAGLDRLKWEIVLAIIKNVFKDVDVNITICFLDDDADFDKCEYVKPLCDLLD